MRVRVVLVVALALVAGALALDMSGRAPRLAATDHTDAAAFVATLQGGQELCQPQMVLPGGVAQMQVLIGTYGAPVPALTDRFLADGDERTVASGRLPYGARQGYVSIPLDYTHGPAVPGTLCIHVGGSKKVVLGGEPWGVGGASEQVADRPQPGRIDVVYMRPGRESWWQLLPTLVSRFGLGKAYFFGDWTLPAMALLLLGVWVATVRLLARELK